MFAVSWKRCIFLSCELLLLPSQSGDRFGQLLQLCRGFVVAQLQLELVNLTSRELGCLSCRLLSFASGRQLNVGRLQSRLGLKKPCGKIRRGAESPDEFGHILNTDIMKMSRAVRRGGGRGAGQQLLAINT